MFNWDEATFDQTLFFNSVEYAHACNNTELLAKLQAEDPELYAHSIQLIEETE